VDRAEVEAGSGTILGETADEVNARPPHREWLASPFDRLPTGAPPG
jgi:hypothetical protein